MSFVKKWYTYQKERFPVLMYGIYIFAIAFSTFCFSNWVYMQKFLSNPLSELMGKPMPFVIDWKILLAMFIVAFLQFLMVRIIDEFKDYEEDCKYRPYRPVPRGLITLKELKVLFIICGVLQLLITYVECPKAIPLLILVWIFFAIMSKSFFMKSVLEKNLLLEVTFDELLMPVLVLYLSAFPFGEINVLLGFSYFYLFLFMTYIISWIVEIARKIRCKEDEEKGVKTYTAVFGIKKAILLLFVLETILAVIQGVLLGKEKLVIVITVYVLINVLNLLFILKQKRVYAKLVELSANIYIFLVYFSMFLLVK